MSIGVRKNKNCFSVCITISEQTMKWITLCAKWAIFLDEPAVNQHISKEIFKIDCIQLNLANHCIFTLGFQQVRTP